MYEYVEGKAMWANVSTPNTKFEPHKYGIVVLTDEDTANRLEGIGLSRVRTRDGQNKYDEPAFSFSRKVEKHIRFLELFAVSTDPSKMHKYLSLIYIWVSF